MKIYMVYSQAWEGEFENKGIFSTPEKAQAKLDLLESNEPKGTFTDFNIEVIDTETIDEE